MNFILLIAGSKEQGEYYKSRMPSDIQYRVRIVTEPGGLCGFLPETAEILLVGEYWRNDKLMELLEERGFKI